MKRKNINILLQYIIKRNKEYWRVITKLQCRDNANVRWEIEKKIV